MTALVVFAAAGTALFLRLITWGLAPLVAFLVVSVGASAVTLGTLVCCELAGGRHDARRRHQLWCAPTSAPRSLRGGCAPMW